MQSSRGPVIGVVGGVGGVGTSTFAAVLAAVSSGVLVDLDAASGGIDVLLGIDDVAGSRWSGVRVGGGRLDPAALRDGLPRWGAVSVLAADESHSADAAHVVIDAAASSGAVVIDLGRGVADVQRAASGGCDLLLVLAPAEVRALAAVRATAAALDVAACAAVLRRGSVGVHAAAELTGLPLVATLQSTARRADVCVDPNRLPRQLRRAAAGILDAFGP